jgi:hypothetical protein
MNSTRQRQQYKDNFPDSHLRHTVNGFTSRRARETPIQCEKGLRHTNPMQEGLRHTNPMREGIGAHQFNARGLGTHKSNARRDWGTPIPCEKGCAEHNVQDLATGVREGRAPHDLPPQTVELRLVFEGDNVHPDPQARGHPPPLDGAVPHQRNHFGQPTRPGTLGVEALECLQSRY